MSNITLSSCGQCTTIVSVRDLCLDSGTTGPTVGGTAAEFLAGISTGMVNMEDFASVADGSYPSIVVPSGTYFHYDYSATGLFAGTQRTITSEDPISQNAASLPQRGIETVGGGTTSYNSIIHCLPSPIGFWGADVLDAESTVAFGEARIITYDAALTVLSDDTFSGGEDIVQFVGVTNIANNISYVQIVVGDQNGPPLADQLAYTNVVYGTIDELLSVVEYKEVTCLTSDGVLQTTVYDEDGNPVTDQTVIDQLQECEVDPVEIVDYEYLRIPICDTDTTTSGYQQFLYINDVLQTPTMFFDIAGNEIPAPANFTLGYCVDPGIDFEESVICINNTIQGIRRVYIQDQVEIAVEYYDNMGQVIPIPAIWDYGFCGTCPNISNLGTIADWSALS